MPCGLSSDFPSRKTRLQRARSGITFFAFLITAIGVVPDLRAQNPVLSSSQSKFVNFESGPVRPLLLSPDGQTLYSLNTPDHRLEIYQTWRKHPTSGSGKSLSLNGNLTLDLWLIGSVFVGLEPVSLALHPEDSNRLFVSNHISDTVSVVDVREQQVIATLQVGDEPRGVVVAQDRLFVACSRAPEQVLRPGQIDPGEFQQNTVTVFQASAPFQRLAMLNLDAVAPRDLITHDGKVYVIPLNSSNDTVLLNETKAEDLGIKQEDADAFDGTFDINPILLRPEINNKALARGWYIPDSGRIVNDWEYPTHVAQLPDNDVLSIDVKTLTLDPMIIHGVGTTLFTIERNPHNGELWVLNQESLNRTRFEPRVKGNAILNRITRVNPDGTVGAFISLDVPFTSQPHAQPVAIAFSENPQTPFAYVATIGTSTLIIFHAVDLSPIAEIPLDFMPTGLAIDDERSIVYVHARGDKTIRAYDIAQDHAAIGPTRSWNYDPEPPTVTVGRRHLYEARSLQGHGNGSMSCASCHIFGHHDHTAWDLGDPEGGLGYFFPDIMTDIAGFEGEIVALPNVPILSPLKGPMVTQSFRGLTDPDTRDDVPLHWRGDRRVFQTFRGAYKSLLGGTGIGAEAIQQFSGFIRTLRYGPNPYQDKDRQYRGESFEGMNKYGVNADFEGKEYNFGAGIFCVSCHKGNFIEGTDFTGSRPTVSAGAFEQLFNTAQLRQSYEKDFRHLTGYGVLHDGAVDGVRGFLDFHKPDYGPEVFPNLTPQDRDQIGEFIRRWDSGLSPLVGYQFTLNQDSVVESIEFLDLAENQAEHLGNIDLILKGYRQTGGGESLRRGARFGLDPQSQTWRYQFDTGDWVDRSILLSLVIQGVAEFTLTCVPPEQGVRLGIDQDEDGLLDSQELAARTSPSNPDSDGDGYTDGFEISVGANPHRPDALLVDNTAPTILMAAAREIFHRSATLEVRADEPVSVTATFGLSPGDSSLGSVAGDGLRTHHDLSHIGLAAGETIHYELSVADRNGNSTLASGTFDTLPPFLHVEDIVLTKSGSGPYTVEAQVLVHNHLGQPVNNVPIRGYFAGDIGGQTWNREERTGPNGWATFALNPFTPQGATQVSFSPAYLGSLDESDPFFVGYGGEVPNHFYDQPSNRINYQTIDVP